MRPEGRLHARFKGKTNINNLYQQYFQQKIIFINNQSRITHKSWQDEPKDMHKVRSESWLDECWSCRANEKTAIAAVVAWTEYIKFFQNEMKIS